MLGAKNVTLRRPAVADATIRASVQPEGKQDRSREMRRVFTTTELRVANPDTPLRADQIITGGRTYDVIEVFDHTDAPALKHYEALVEEEGTDAVTVSTPTSGETMGHRGDVSRTTTDDSTTGWMRRLTFREVQAGAGAYRQGDVVFRTKRDNLTVDPTTETYIVQGSVTYQVIVVDLDDRTQRWLLTARRVP